MKSWDYLPHLQRGPAAGSLAKAEAPRYIYDICLRSKQGSTWASMTCFTGGAESQKTGTLEVNSEGGKPRGGPEKRDADLSNRSLAYSQNQSTYSAELYAIVKGLQLIDWARNRGIVIQSSSMSALQSIAEPRQQAGQEYLKKIYKLAEKMTDQGCKIWTQ